jgi:threonine aldolase
MMIDFRSDTVTKPSQGMIQAMMEVPVGDDVFGEDPTINLLEKTAADMFGMDAGVFCPSGTMTNQIAIKVHTQAGDEVICDKMSHVYLYEGGGIAFNSGCSVRLIDGDRGRITAAQVVQSINPEDVHKPISTLVSVENTANRGGGACYNFNQLEKIKTVCTENNLKFHLDGARIWNALIAKNETPKQYGALFNSISFCLSKGLGTPVGSVLLGDKDFIKKARRWRKVFGGGMRQAGFVAAAGLYALENNIKRLAQDHEHAQIIAGVLKEKDFVGEILPVETNIIIFEIKGRLSANEFVEKMKANNIWMFAVSTTQVRMVLHLDITPSMVAETIDTINRL